MTRVQALSLGLLVVAVTVPLAHLLTEAPAPGPVVASSSPAPAPEESPPWTIETIRELQPVAPTRNDAVSRPLPAMKEYDEALLTLGRVVEAGDGDPDNAWAIAHGLLARGPEFRLTTGLAALPHLFAVFAEPRQIGAITLVGFPKERAGVPAESHTDLILKNLTEIGVQPGAAFPMGDGTVTAADLYRYTVLKTFLHMAENRSSFRDPNDMPWGLQALAAWAPQDGLRWVATDGTPMDLDELTHFVVAVVAKESKFMFDAARAGQGFERKGQPLFSYTCGGAHLVQGAAYAVARGFGEKDDRTHITKQGLLLLYRLPIELAIYDDAMKTSRHHRERLLVQRMKFLGHWLETMSKLQILGLFTPDEQQARSVEGAAQNLVLTVSALAEYGTFDRLAAIRVDAPQLYLDVVGDAAHAIRGLELALGRQTLPW